MFGKYRSADDLGQSPRGDGVGAYLNPRGYAILDALDQVAAKHNATPAQVALAWIIAAKGVTAPIASATSLRQLNDMIRSTQLTLDGEDMRALDEAGSSLG